MDSPTLHLSPTAGSTNSGKTVEELVREAHAHLAATGVSLSPSKVSRLIRGYETSPERDTVSLTRWLESRSRVNGYLDTTGATATYRADLSRGGRR